MSLTINVVAEEIFENSDNGVLDLFAEFNNGAVRCIAVNDMVMKVESLAGTQKIGLLRLFGHGSPGAQWLGGGFGGNQGDFVKRPGQAIFLNGIVLNQEHALARLQGRFENKAVLELHGCSVGVGPAGRALCVALAKLWNVTVRAGTDLQSADKGNAYESGFIQVYPDGRVIQYSHGSPKFIVLAPGGAPKPVAPPPVPSSFEADYLTKTGTILSNVSKERYGTFELWPLIFEDNRATLKDGPNRIPSGVSLKIRRKVNYTAAELAHAKKTWQNWQSYK